MCVIVTAQSLRGGGECCPWIINRKFIYARVYLCWPSRRYVACTVYSVHSIIRRDFVMQHSKGRNFFLLKPIQHCNSNNKRETRADVDCANGGGEGTRSPCQLYKASVAPQCWSDPISCVNLSVSPAESGSIMSYIICCRLTEPRRWLDVILFVVFNSIQCRKAMWSLLANTVNGKENFLRHFHGRPIHLACPSVELRSALTRGVCALPDSFKFTLSATVTLQIGTNISCCENTNCLRVPSSLFLC